jgi:hypothetical protein
MVLHSFCIIFSAFIYGLFNSAVSSSGYIASNKKMNIIEVSKESWSPHLNLEIPECETSVTHSPVMFCILNMIITIEALCR